MGAKLSISRAALVAVVLGTPLGEAFGLVKLLHSVNINPGCGLHWQI
ncbi:hypothetical protein NDI37_03875 [Funiculus sociatus GB2-A5]|uniref:Uncharacterized protein n=1 Tax=Funiculus sociatus GB2-A5 TaxID=2933946 RepID=A0ABV0JKS0_9CYAN|nr:hypothetical protein [Trichocoleus sp. FACHB-6]MBD2061680.1 hypothetical protein [Trichocoleus sp. FACHB-6]